ncbi:hypothetical protein GGS20DRAFT_582442 [Poronia punctata]|nr:hypothetical protein GGS20DRAFT_582442 [Poronia punctata]
MDIISCCSSARGTRHGEQATGWKQAAKVNCAVLIIFSVVLLILQGVAIPHGALKVFFFYGNDCEGGIVSTINTALHIAINIASSLVVMSQLPSGLTASGYRRAKVLNGGVGGLASSNFFMQILNSPSREEVDETHLKGSWLDIGVPSARNAFRVSGLSWDAGESEYHFTIASEEFINGGPYYPPGASLILPGLTSIELRWHANGPESKLPNAGRCTSIPGWIRDDMWKLGPNSSAFWDRYVPSKARNNLFFDTHCSMTASFRSDGSMFCFTLCDGIESADEGPVNSDTGWNFVFAGDYISGAYPWPDRLIDDLPSDWDIETSLQPQAFDLTVDHCLAHPIQSRCQIGLSPILLLAVTICVLVKTATAILVTMVLSRQKQAPLATLGDAIESFIEKPDPVNVGYCTIGQAEIRKALGSNSSVLLSEPREWWFKGSATAAALPWTVWVTSYLLFSLGIGACGGLFSIPHADVPTIMIGSFLQSDKNPFAQIHVDSLLSAVFLANCPQLALSSCYLAASHSFKSGLVMAREWAKYGDKSMSLRVTDPKGQQRSTYRLQLPYRYSLPLIGISILLHWILSNTIYVFISTGGYYNTAGYTKSRGDTGLPANTAFFLTYSAKPLLALLVLSIFLISMPPLLSYDHLPAGMTMPGCNSFAISAACHVSRISYAIKNRSLSDESSPRPSRPPSKHVSIRATKYTAVNEQEENDWIEGPTSAIALTPYHSQSELTYVGIDGDDDDNDNEKSMFSKLAQSKLRWGVVPMSSEWYEENKFEGRPVGHLSFGVEEDNVSPPIEGELYA